ncbi:helix-turn-helix domain-containing protein [uncultured Lamprocystis sp.]|jgi:predicted HTH transcriptional regulator|uniref:AlbA family DNA-binding domain-containing protein n=1 Tax=uncultured Lamprocystis sp. TaxID=543132 RepID=UPI0025F7F1BD|nr:ATP-binding protein [uncultured Lamprocystis sp.]
MLAVTCDALPRRAKIAAEEDLLRLIEQGENSGVEFKRDALRPEQLARDVVAFANFQGGRLLIGVEDDGVVSGMQRNDLERWVMDTVFGRTVHPQLLPYYEEVRLDDGQRVAVVTVLPGTAKPYVVPHHLRIFISASAVPRNWRPASNRRPCQCSYSARNVGHRLRGRPAAFSLRCHG